MTARLGQTIRLFVFIALAVTAAMPVWAEEGEFYVNTLRNLGKVSPGGTRTRAMGGGGRGLADGVASLGVNPAALGAFTGTAMDIGLGFDWLDDGHDNTDQVSFKIGGAVNLDRWTKTSNYNQSIGGLLYTENYSGAADVSMKRHQTSVLFGYGVHLLDNLLVGASVALYNGKWNSDIIRADEDPLPELRLNRKFNGGDFKLGGLYRVQDETTIGGTLGYTTGSYKELASYNTTGTGSLERFSIGAGVAHQYARETLLLGDIWYENLTADLPGTIRERTKSWGLSAGIEQQVIPEILALRGGIYYERVSYSGGNDTITFVNNNSFSKGRFGFTAGAGVRLYNFDLGYSLDVNSNGNVKNMVDFSTQW